MVKEDVVGVLAVGCAAALPVVGATPGAGTGARAGMSVGAGAAASLLL